MADIFSARKRRQIMQSVRRERTAPEQRLSQLLIALDVSFQTNVAILPGKPDFFLPDTGLVVFVHGCFWHGHSACRKGTTRPKTNRKYWRQKIDCNSRRDRRVARQLRALGFRVYTVWECQLTTETLPTRLASRIINLIGAS